MATAIKAQQSYISVSTASAAPDTITGITNANPGVVTAAGHGIANGAIVTIAAVVGMVQVNDRAFVVANQATNTVELKGVDTSTTQGYSAYGSGGTLTAHTMTEIGNVTSMDGFDGQANDIDTTHLRSFAEEVKQGIQRFGNVQLGLQIVSDTGQAKLRALKESQTAGVFSITLSDGTVAAFYAFVKSFSFSGLNPDGTVTGQVTLRVTNAPSWFA